MLLLSTTEVTAFYRDLLLDVVHLLIDGCILEWYNADARINGLVYAL